MKTEVLGFFLEGGCFCFLTEGRDSMYWVITLCPSVIEVGLLN